MWQELALKPQLSAKKASRDLGRRGVMAEEEKLMIKGRGGNLSPFDHAEDAIWAVVETRT